MEKVFKWRNSSITYSEIGNGPLPMIAFHGYGQDRLVFHTLLPGFGDQYTIYAIDLPYHGNTRWKEQYILTRDDLEDLANSFIKLNNIETSPALLGYSIGGNYVLGLAQKRPEIIDTIWLIAADGLQPKPLFNFITRTLIGRFLFKGFVFVPEPAFLVLSLAEFLGIIPKRVVRFYKSSIDTRIKRKLLYMRWRSVSRIRCNLEQVKKQIRDHHIPVRLIFGKNDGVIPVENAKRFVSELPSAELIITDQGHQMLEDSTNAHIRQMLELQKQV